MRLEELARLEAMAKSLIGALPIKAIVTFDAIARALTVDLRSTADAGGTNRRRAHVALIRSRVDDSVSNQWLVGDWIARFIAQVGLGPSWSSGPPHSAGTQEKTPH